MTNADLRAATHDLLAEYAGLLDAENYQSWLDLFADNCVYKIVSRENDEQGLPAALMLCETKKALTDRIVALLKVVHYSPHHSHRLLSNIRILGRAGDIVNVEATYALYHTNVEGRSQLFGVGLYRDRLLVEDKGLRFLEKIVVIDSFSITAFLAKPI
jgi:anthranilate 1,2-dioxygenase small subunit